MAQDAFTAPAPQAMRRRAGTAGITAPLLAAFACAVSLALVWVIAELLPAARVRDAAVLGDFIRLNTPSFESAGMFLLHLLEPRVFILWAAVIVSVALARRRPDLAIAAAVVMGLAPLTSETLKPLLAHPHLSAGPVLIGPASWPSGHSTAAMTLVLCAILVSPARLRPVVVLVGGIFAVAVAVTLLVLAWHMPSDVVGGFLVAGLWVSLAVAVLRAVDWHPRGSVNT
jgi:membrane-associated phospholipid phosphatase